MATEFVRCIESLREEPCHESRRTFSLSILLALLVAGCAATPPATERARLERRRSRRAPCSRKRTSTRRSRTGSSRSIPSVSATSDVRTILAAGPTPRIVSLHGGIYPVHLVMESFARFLIGMGYPESKIRHPGDGRLSHSPYENSAQIAGLIAWYYERDGLRPLIIGHSQGGIQAVKVLHELAGDVGERVRVWNPLTDRAENRTTILDPLTGRERPVVGLKVGYASAVGAGRRGAAAAEPVEHGRPLAHHSRHGRGLHRLLARRRSDRVGSPGRRRDVPEQRHRESAQRRIARRATRT